MMRKLKLKVVEHDTVPINYKGFILHILRQPTGGTGVGAWNDVEELRRSGRVQKKVEGFSDGSVMKLDDDDYEFIAKRVKAYRMWPVAHDNFIQFIDDVEKGSDDDEGKAVT